MKINNFFKKIIRTCIIRKFNNYIKVTIKTSLTLKIGHFLKKNSLEKIGYFYTILSKTYHDFLILIGAIC